jgi:hypothetical protein
METADPVEDRRFDDLVADVAGLADGELTDRLRAHSNCAPSQVTRLRRMARLLAAAPAVGDDLAAGRVGIDQVADLGRAFANPRCGHRLPDSLGVLVESARRLKFTDFC